VQSESALALVPTKKENKGDGKDGGEEEYKAKVKSKYAPKQVKLHLEDAADDDAYWRGYESARRRVVLPNEEASRDAADTDGEQ